MELEFFRNFRQACSPINMREADKPLFHSQTCFWRCLRADLLLLGTFPTAADPTPWQNIFKQPPRKVARKVAFLSFCPLAVDACLPYVDVCLYFFCFLRARSRLLVRGRSCQGSLRKPLSGMTPMGGMARSKLLTLPSSAPSPGLARRSQELTCNLGRPLTQLPDANGARRSPSLCAPGWWSSGFRSVAALATKPLPGSAC